VGLTELEEQASDDEFSAFADRLGAPLLRALVAVFGPHVGREASLDALAWGWEHWARLSRMRNPAGYLYRVGTTAARRELRRRDRTELRADASDHTAHEDHPGDPDLERALAHLTDRQRAAVVLVVGHGMPLREAAALLGCSISSLRNHVDRALRHLRNELEHDDAAE